MATEADTTRSTPIYIGTVCLEKNRWGSKEPSFRVSEWAERFKADGFDGIELWENHYLRADESEQDELTTPALPITIFNTYYSFTDDTAEARKAVAAAATRLKAPALKYNVGYDGERLEEYRRNLLALADELPPDCRLLCECHQGTALETPEAASAFLADLDPARFGIMIHPSTDPEATAAWFDACGDRLQHLHMQMRTPETAPSTVTGRDMMNSSLGIVKSHGFSGSLAVEFTRGIGKEEDIETLYANACADLNYIRKVMNS